MVATSEMAGNGRHVCTRDRDNEVLGWIKARIAGLTPTQIAKGAGVEKSKVTMAIGRVLRADLEESGEDQSAVMKAYWK